MILGRICQRYHRVVYAKGFLYVNHSIQNHMHTMHNRSNLCIYIFQIPRDLKLDHLVKVISPEGRVLQGRVRYVGPVPGREDAHVGVELPSVNGSSDGTFHGRRFFDW